MGRRIAILAGVRTPFAKAGGSLHGLGADDLGAIAVKEVLARTGLDPAILDEVIIGNVAQPPHAANIARVIALKAGIPQSVIAHTVHRNCASGMQSITAAAMKLQTGRAEIVLAGGAECMSQIPLLYGAQMTQLLVRMMRARSLRQRVRTLASFRPAFLRPVVALQLGLTDPVCELNMGQTAELLAREFGITRDQQDAYAIDSHRKAAEAIAAGCFNEEVVPVLAPPYKRATTLDDAVRPDLTPERLARLRPFFDRHAGTVTAGNACPITDGAVALIVATEARAKTLGIEPLGYLRGWSYAALDGSRMGLGPTFATARLLEETGLKVSDFDLIELNEAFAAQVIANLRAFESREFARDELDRRQALGEIDEDRLNVNGGAIALGHPVGATGARLVLTLLHELSRRRGKLGLATLCVGGGQGAALALEAA